MKKAKRIRKTIVYLILAGFSCAFILPLLWMIRSSLMDLGEIFQVPPLLLPKTARFDNYAKAMTIVPFGLYFLNTIVLVVLTLAGTVFTSSLTAYSFARLRWKGREFWFRLILTSMMLPGAVTLIPTFIGWKTIGFYNTIIPLVVPAFFGGGAFNIFLLRQFYNSIPLEFDEAAFMDGASFFRIYASIILPLSRSAVIVVAIFAFLGTWNDFFGPLIYLNDSDKFTVALGLQMFQGSYNAEWGLLMAASTVVVAPAIAVFLFGQKYFIEGITMTGLKG